MPRPLRAVIAGLVRDCAPMLPSVLANCEMMASAFQRSSFLFLENNSRDRSRALLERWADGRPDATILSPTDAAAFSRVRTVRLAALRNQIVAEARARHPDFDVLVLLDCDEVNATPTPRAPFLRALDFLWADQAHAGVFANTLGHYYDMWALRHDRMCPGDIWEMAMDHALAHGVSAQQAIAAVYAPRLFALPAEAPPLEVDSAFGGLGIYRLSRVFHSQARYEGHKLRTIAAAQGVREIGWQQCEHVSFHAGLTAAGGRLFILPWLAIGAVSEVHVRNSWEHALFDPSDLAAAPEIITPLPPQPAFARNQPCHCGSGQRFKHCHGTMAA